MLCDGFFVNSNDPSPAVCVDACSTNVECQIGLQRGCVTVARLVQPHPRISAGSFPSVFHRKRERNDLPLHVDRTAQSCCLRSREESRDKGWTASEAKPAVEGKKARSFLHTYAPVVLTPRRSSAVIPLGWGHLSLDSTVYTSCCYRLQPAAALR